MITERALTNEAIEILAARVDTAALERQPIEMLTVA